MWELHMGLQTMTFAGLEDGYLIDMVSLER